MTVVYKLAFLRARCVALVVMLSVLAGFPYLAPGEELNQLIQQLKSPDPFARFAAAGKVAELGPSAADAAGALLEPLKCEQIEALSESPQIAATRQRFADALIRIGERVTPQPGSFYGSWITRDIVGPFKGESGSAGWSTNTYERLARRGRWYSGRWAS